ncbi:MAG: metal ABC transporter permease [Parvibaculales bacterium]
MLATAFFVSLMATPLGCLVVWRRMAYFGDALSHTALLGIALGLLMGGNAHLGAIFICAIFAFAMIWMENRYKLSTDTLLGILAHGGLAVGILTLSLLPPQNQTDGNADDGHAKDVDLHDYEQYFFGDLSQTSGENLMVLGFSVMVILALLWRYWSKLILMILSEELATAEGHNTLRLKYVLLTCLTVTVALSVQTVGILFTTSLLILPAAAARQWSRTPRNTVIYAYIASLSALALGVPTALDMALPYGPVIVAYMSAFFVISLMVAGIIRKKPPRI